MLSVARSIGNVRKLMLADVANVELIALETDDSWARDIAPTL